jgi:hypothetical protein
MDKRDNTRSRSHIHNNMGSSRINNSPISNNNHTLNSMGRWAISHSQWWDSNPWFYDARHAWQCLKWVRPIAPVAVPALQVWFQHLPMLLCRVNRVVLVI